MRCNILSVLIGFAAVVVAAVDVAISSLVVGPLACVCAIAVGH